MSLSTLAPALASGVMLGCCYALVALGFAMILALTHSLNLAHDTLARVLPLRDTFVAMFFVTMGLLIDPRILRANLGLLAVIVGLTVLGKLAVWPAVVRLFRQGLTTAVRVGLGLGQIGEFSFVLVQAAHAAGHVGADVSNSNATLAASVLTILLNALLVRGIGGWLRRPAEAGA
ncbi:MAG: cation:proton antiporter [Candidatus Rokubacteria bacterium]|nr:cation:proton antiporter [Candidatus Rokubacteria bacterium]